jgi:hypothetical protein
VCRREIEGERGRGRRERKGERERERERWGRKLLLFVSVQGDAAFWWNLKKSGDGDLRTRHAGCPVLVGSKWGKRTLMASSFS